MAEARFATSTKGQGSMGASRSLTEEMEQNRHRFLRSRLNTNYKKAVVAGLVHGSAVMAVEAEQAGHLIEDHDGLITATPNLPLVATSFDCSICFLRTAPENPRQAIGIVHAGWRGTAAGVLLQAIGGFKDSYGVPPHEILIDISPSIRPCCYEVKKDVARLFRRQWPTSIKKDGEKIYINIPEALILQAVATGVAKKNIFVDAGCTACTKNKRRDWEYFSWRRDRRTDGVLLSAIVLKE